MKSSLVLLLVLAVSIYGATDNSKYSFFNAYLNQLENNLQSFAQFFDHYTDIKHFNNFIIEPWAVDYVIFSTSKEINFALDYVKEQLTEDSYNETQKEKFKIIQKDLTEAKENTDFLGEKMKVCLNKFPSVSEEDTEAKKEALSELKNYALDKPFLHLIQHIRDQNKQIMDHQVMNE